MIKYIQFSLLLAFFSCLVCNAQQTDTTICIKPEIDPSFQYDTCTTTRESLKYYYLNNFKMPEYLLDFGLSGNPILLLTIEKDGRISNVELIRGIIPQLDKVVVEFTKQMPPWKPAMYKGKAVRSKFHIRVLLNWLY